ncbi:hypothetical protein [Vibrio barjaei]|uniref:hypothetical protein n=1 Tax=Vibrio barjaei TaxID=1676683 RepID=UPI002284D9BE|nr:hypothetical protein [Vibrio barjaei]MCY9872944.1 hypothetical protein [Vibrio barjaei]
MFDSQEFLNWCQSFMKNLVVFDSDDGEEFYFNDTLIGRYDFDTETFTTTNEKITEKLKAMYAIYRK